MDLRKLKFDRKGRLNGKRATRRQAKKVTIVVKPKKVQESGDESTGSMVLLVSDNGGTSCDSDGGEGRMKSNPFAALRPKRVKKVASAKKEAMPAHGDSDVVVETERERELSQQLRMAEDATEKAEGKVDLMEQKLQGKDRQKLPPIVAARISACESAEKFSTVCEGNHYAYLDMQVIAHIYAQALDKKPHVKEGEKEENTKVPPEYQRPAEMLKLVSAILNEKQRAKKLDGRTYMKPNGNEWAQEVLKRFWAKWNEDFPDVLQASRKASMVEIWNADWLNMRFWYYISPERMLALLEGMQVRALEIGVGCTHEMVKRRFGELVLPAIGGFRVWPGPPGCKKCLRRWE
jgi:hypothetical protein